jgi:hypothetical protein
LTGATGFLGRYLLLEWLQRMELVDGTLICLVRANSDEDARQRFDKTFDSGDPQLLAHFRELAADHLQVIAGDKGEAKLGLDQQTWQRLADTVDTFVQVDRVGFVAGFPDTPSDPAVVVLNPDDEITPESFAAWFDRRQAGKPADHGVRAADTLAEARVTGEV